MATEKRKTLSRRSSDISAQSQQIKYDALIESIGEGLIAIGDDGAIEHVNAYAAEALGVSRQELIGKLCSEVIVIVDQHNVQVDPLECPMPRALSKGAAISEYTNMMRKDGTLFPVHITASPIIINGRPTGAIEVFRDLTYEQELDMAKDDFVSIASHQLRTPATGIRGILSMVLSGDFGELTTKQRHYLNMALRSNNRQLNIIEDLLSVARADSGRLDLVLEKVSLTALVAEVVAEHRMRIAENEQRLEMQLAPEIFAMVDNEKVKMVVDNLVSNAAKYTRRGGIIRVELSRDKGSATLKVQDDGVGIPKDQQRAIFAKFMRIENELSVPAGGTGLGLYLALKIVKLHRGDIVVSSEVGHGSTFRVMLPVDEGLQLLPQ